MTRIAHDQMADDVAGFRRLVRTGFGFTMNICLAVMCYLLVFAEPVVLFVSGEAFAGADHRRGEPHVVRQLLCGDVHPVPAGPRGADGHVEHRGGPGERGAQRTVGRPVRGGGRALRFWPPRRPSCASSSGAPATCSRPSCARATWRAWRCPTRSPSRCPRVAHGCLRPSSLPVSERSQSRACWSAAP